MALFGTNGIRGIPNENYYPDFYLHLSITIGNIIKSEKFAVASDGRKTVAMLKGAVLSGLTATGHDVVDLGTLPVSGLQYYCKMNGVPGIMITASHNPPEYNGIKVIDSDGLEASPELQAMIEKRYLEARYNEVGRKDSGNQNYASWEHVGSVKYDYSAKDTYIEAVLSKIDVESVREKKLSALVDCSNGATYETAPQLLRALGIRTVALNSTLDGTFPGHNPEPTEENIKSTIEVVKNLGGDFALVHDSDGDRVVFISPEGKYLDGNYALSILAMSRLKKGDAVVTPANTSDIFINTAKKIGAKVYITKVGPPLVSRKAIEVKARLAGEETGGIIYTEHQYGRDGAMTAALFIEAVAKYGLRNMLKSLPDLYYKRSRVNTTKGFDEIKRLVLEQKHTKADFTDGVKIYLNSTDWVMLRPSGTEPIIRIYVQASSRKVVEALIKKYGELLA